MTDLVQSFSELSAAQQASAGGKGGTLARLYQAGFPVPDGFVIMPAAFAGDELQTAAWAQIQTHLARLRGSDSKTAFAVRSSALGEDSAQASFAGEFESVLNVQTEDAIRQAIDTVRWSRNSERVQSYSRSKGIDAGHEIAVVVQRMVLAQISGVVFTVDPISGNRAVMSGNFVHGLGEQLVSGQASGETFTLEGRKGLWPGVDYTGPPELKRFARPLYRLASRLERELEKPQDIEWAIAGEKVYLLQSRPITTLPGSNAVGGEWNDSLRGDYLWSNVNFGEAVTEVMTPLSWTVLQYIFGEWVVLPGYQTVGNIGGRPYLNISLFATLFHALGQNRQKLLRALEGTLYMGLPEEMEIPLLPISRWSVLAGLPQMIRTRMMEKNGLKSLPTYLATNPTRCSQMRQRIREAGTKAELLSVWQQEIGPHVSGSLWMVMGSVSHYSDYTTKLRRQLTKLVGPDDADALISNLNDPLVSRHDSGLLASLGPLVNLARVARGEMDRAAYLEQYGHRGPHEFELSVPRPAEDPAWLDQQLSQFNQSPVNVEALLARQRARFEAAWTRFQARYPHRAKSMRRRIAQVAPRARMREAARSEYTRDRWLVRAFALRAGQLTGLEDDLFFLTLDEMLDLLAGDETATRHIVDRRQTYQKYKALPSYPSIIRGRFDPLQWATDPDRRSDIFDAWTPLPTSNLDEATIIVGSPGAAGQVTGLVRRLERPEEGEQLQAGEVLVATQTDIAWTPLFSRAAAIVTDVGAPLSHAAIVARELGIPAVVGCGGATMRLKTGDQVRVDGGRGVVDILMKEKTKA